MVSSTGRKPLIFSSPSTISTTSGRSWESRRIFVVWMWLECPNPTWAPQHCCPGEVHFACFQYDRFIQRPMLIFVVFAKKYSEKNGVARYLHATPPLSALTFDCKDMSGPDRNKTQRVRKNDISHGAAYFPLIQEIEVLQAEGRERGISAAEPGHDKLARRCTKEHAPIWSHGGCGKSNDERTDHVDERACPREKSPR